jgi:prepilin-type N-terminal cleavage/methylation domain-containing protein
MEHSRHHPKKQQPAGQAGFSLIEIMVVIAVMGAISAAIVVNWSSFMRHQELRQDAITLHKEIMALKARAIEYGYDDTLACPTDAGPCTIKWYEPHETDETKSVPRTKTITVNNGVKIEILPNNMSSSGDLTTPIAADDNKWKNTSTGKVEIVAEPNNLEAYKTGGILLRSDKANARYLIQKDPSSIRPELYNQSKAGAAWKRM